MDLEQELLQLDSLPGEILLFMLQFLDVVDLCRISQCSSRWNALASDDSVWIKLCREHWSDKQNKALTPERTQTLQNTLLGFKCWYRHEDIDGRREKITKADLVDNVWCFRFHYSPNYAQYPVFTDDMKLHMDGRSMRWRFTDDNNRIQVEQYPALTPSRLPNWGWRLQNNFVSFTSQSKDRPREAPSAAAQMAQGRLGDDIGDDNEPGDPRLNYLLPLYNIIVMALAAPGEEEQDDDDDDDYGSDEAER